MKLYDDKVLNGAIDIHIHAGPDYMPRYADSVTLAQEAAACGMRAIVTKCHLFPTVGAAAVACELVPQVKTFGSISLNETAGGLSPRSVMAAVLTGAKVIWLPTVDSKYNLEKAKQGHWIKHYVNSSSFGYHTGRLSVTDEEGRLLPAAQEILRICKEKEAALCSGHISPQECLAVAREAKKISFSHFEITHANAWPDDFTPPVLSELVENGALVSISYGVCSPRNGRQDPEEIAALIKALGAQNCIIMTDYGQVTSPSPVQGLRAFYYLLKASGITESELNLMLKENPARLLYLS
ncbi:MAG: DUF6282 family protein [Acidaminococcales bacterium]|jgi:hypothetical protein|nr:DUF6282 family protein [Acidaminococcales bacterium]